MFAGARVLVIDNTSAAPTSFLFRVVLMPATADVARYQDYSKDLGRVERVEVLAFPSSNQHALSTEVFTFMDLVAFLHSNDDMVHYDLIPSVGTGCSLIYAGKQLGGDKAARDYSIEGGSVLNLVIALRDGSF
ncbi:unnamed protein product [Dovyalis caffra]|uniref:Ubiquitin-like domain-containing protein n=1 Tax=Dovyalis caffra TaxID=77055 RepID=A0AAV1RVR0_9ROSI|nr:unnamed protein product [Dovyalis caffra]